MLKERTYDNFGHALWTEAELRSLVDGIQSGLLISEIEIPGRTQSSKESKAHLLGLRSRMRKHIKTTIRPCICCRQPIRSEHFGHRMCIRCAKASEEYACI